MYLRPSRSASLTAEDAPALEAPARCTSAVASFLALSAPMPSVDAMAAATSKVVQCARSGLVPGRCQGTTWPLAVVATNAATKQPFEPAVLDCFAFGSVTTATDAQARSTEAIASMKTWAPS